MEIAPKQAAAVPYFWVVLRPFMELFCPLCMCTEMTKICGLFLRKTKIRCGERVISSISSIHTAQELVTAFGRCEKLCNKLDLWWMGWNSYGQQEKNNKTSWLSQMTFPKPLTQSRYCKKLILCMTIGAAGHAPCCKSWVQQTLPVLWPYRLIVITSHVQGWGGAAKWCESQDSGKG